MDRGLGQPLLKERNKEFTLNYAQKNFFESNSHEFFFAKIAWTISFKAHPYYTAPLFNVVNYKTDNVTSRSALVCLKRCLLSEWFGMNEWNVFAEFYNFFKILINS